MFVSAPIKAKFVEPMLLQRTDSLPDGTDFAYEVKLDGYRALGIKTDGKVHLRSRNNKDFNSRYPGIARALGTLPDETVIDGELVALDDSGRPSFNALQNYGSSKAPIIYYVFDVLIVAGRNVVSVRTPFDAPRSATAPPSSEAPRTDPRIPRVECHRPGSD